MEEIVSLHDKHQFEVKLGYPLKNEHKETSYHLSLYLFTPYTLGIKPPNYTKEDFYRDLHAYVRFKTPQYSLSQIYLGEESFFSKLGNKIAKLVHNQNARTLKDYEYHIKLFGCILKSSLRDEAEFIKDQASESEREFLLQEYYRNVSSILSLYRGFIKKINNPYLSPKIRLIYAFGDEYASQVVEFHTLKLLKWMEENKVRYHHAAIVELLTQEREYRQKKGYAVYDAESDNEQAMLRKNMLKKYISSILFLDTRKKKTRFLEQLVLSIAAGLAMIFATAIAFYYQSKYGTFTMGFFTVLVVSYMLKDRIKELAKQYLTHETRKFSHDHSTEIYTHSKEKIGFSKESVNFVKSYHLPASVLRLRKYKCLNEVENYLPEERVVVYHKQLKISSKHLKRAIFPLYAEGINDILRINIFNFLKRMDNPDQSLLVLNKGKVSAVHGERVYNLNLVVRHGDHVNNLKDHLFRIILSKRGIKRIEEVK